MTLAAETDILQNISNHQISTLRSERRTLPNIMIPEEGADTEEKTIIVGELHRTVSRMVGTSVKNF